MLSRVKSAAAWGPNIGIWALFYTVFECFVLVLTEFLYPASNIDIQHHFDKESYCEAPLSYGDHTAQIKDLAKPPVKKMKDEEVGTVKFLNHEEVRLDMYKAYGEDLPVLPKRFNRKRRYEMVRPNLSLIKHDLQGIKKGRKARHQKKKSKKSHAVSSLDNLLKGPESPSSLEESAAIV